jgi:hypothetical protein
MDPISAAIIAAISAGLLSGAADTAKEAVRDAYRGLKGLLQKKVGNNTDAITAVDMLEAHPDSAARQAVLAEAVKQSGISEDAELRRAAEKLIELIGQMPGGSTHVQQAFGNYIAQADRSGHAAVNINQPPATHDE